jgi:AcrR family transcriptional regulator
MSRARFENLEPDRQQRLIDSAAEEFSAQGYDAASLNRIIGRAGMSKSSLYYYFDDKADLFTTLVERSIEFLFKEIGGIDLEKLTAESFWREFEDLFRRLIMLANSNAWYMKLARMFYRLRDNPKHGAPTNRPFQAARVWIARIVARGQALGVIRTDIPDTLLIDSTMGLAEALDRWIVVHWNDLDAEARLRIANEQMNLFRRLLQP